MKRREFLGLAALPLAQALNRQPVRSLRGRVIGIEGANAAGVELTTTWRAAFCRPRITNRTTRAVRIKEVVVFDVELAMPPETALYGEGFQMLSQTGGTLSTPADLSQYTDAKHYRIPETENARAFYGLVTLTPPGSDTTLCAFTSCARFSGRFRLSAGSPEGLRYEPGAATNAANVAQAFRPANAAYRLAAVIDTEGLALGAGETWELEELTIRNGADRGRLLDELGERLRVHHPPLLHNGQPAQVRLKADPTKAASVETPVGSGFPVTPKPSRGEGGSRTLDTSRHTPPTGWCSWYCFGPRVTAQQVLDNLETIARSFPALTYVQIDDGYQSAMGDWLATGAAFGGSVRSALDQIRSRGFQPAIWVAPFIAEAESAVFEEHADWFVKDADGAPLRSDRVTFGGWRRGPWYVLDGTQPAVQNHFEHVFKTMREEWGCTYFKLDANFWGAMHGGTFHDARATRVEAYRRGMQAIVRGAGDAFLLGCNHPIWPSLGLLHGSRSSNDIKRTWDRVMTTARQNLSRNWQNRRLWWNDPDAVVLSEDLTDAECQFHATAIYASGGMVLSGDDLTAIPPARAAILRKLLPPTGIAAEFDDETLRVGRMRLPHARMLCLFNWDDAPRTLTVKLPDAPTITDYWTGERLGRREGAMSIEMAPRSARLLEAVA
jgi:alpha-galactosidase